MNPFVLKRPVITEKTMQLAKNSNAYTFVVDLHANKNQIRETVEQTFGVHVISIQTTTLAGKRRSTGKRRVHVVHEKRKKAIITLKSGEKIAVFEVQG